MKISKTNAAVMTLLLTLPTVIFVGCGKNNFNAPVGMETESADGEVSLFGFGKKKPVDDSFDKLEAKRNSSAADSEWGTEDGKTSCKEGDDYGTPDSKPAPAPVAKPTPAPVAKPVPSPTPVAPPIAKPTPVPAPTPTPVANVGLPAPTGSVTGTQKQDFVAQGELSPTVYFQAIIQDTNSMCSEGDRVNMRDKNGKSLIQICSSTLKKCAMEGSCQINQNGTTRSFNVGGNSGGGPFFFEAKDDDCPFGYGVKLICLDPFYTVAADSRYHQAGEVIYIPYLNGKLLPDGTLHTGYMVVRDVGGGIKGPNRFDFFSGNIHWKDPQNPFTKVNLADSRTRIPYYKVSGVSAEKVRSYRDFPSLPGL